MPITLRFATRGSALAVAQSSWVLAQFHAVGSAYSYELHRVVTEGDRIQDRPLYEVGGKGLFVREIEQALLDGHAEFAVHSMKDLPAKLEAGFAIMSVPPRESPWDILLSKEQRSLSELPRNARVGTSSLRRKLQLLECRTDLEILPLRGNIDTRLRKLDEGQYDAIVLAQAGVKRLGVDRVGVSLHAELIPAIGQGALAIEGRPAELRTRGPEVEQLGRALEDRATRLETDVERTVQNVLGADCVTPVGAYARYDGATDTVTLSGFLASPDGARTARAQLRGSAADALELGAELGRLLQSKLSVVA